MQPQRRMFIAANYMLSPIYQRDRQRLQSASNSYDLTAERGPAAGDARHRFMSLVNLPLVARFRLATSVRVQSAVPYNITTGHDDNGDTISNDRPSGVGGTAARSGASDIGARLSWTVGLASGLPAAPGPQVRIVRGDSADPLGSGRRRRRHEQAIRVELYAQSYNLLNHLNASNFSGVRTSPFFGQPTSAAPRGVSSSARG
jgi:hypothetical protein